MFNKELWTSDFAANLYDSKDWYRVGKDWSAFMSGSIVHIPQFAAGAAVSEITGATALPIAATKQAFDELTFSNKMLAYGPAYVTNLDAASASFDTRSALMKDMNDYLRQAISIEVGNSWLTVETGSVLNTSGTSTRTNIYGQAAVKALTYKDILDARAKLVINTKNVDLNNVYMVVDPILYADILNMSQFQSASLLGDAVKTSGYVGEIAGIKVIVRASGSAVTAGGAKPATILYDDSYDNTHFSSAILFDGSKVGYSLGTMENGEIKVDFTPYAAGYFTDVMQGHSRCGASPLYKAVSNVVPGVVSIIESL